MTSTFSFMHMYGISNSSATFLPNLASLDGSSDTCQIGHEYQKYKSSTKHCSAKSLLLMTYYSGTSHEHGVLISRVSLDAHYFNQ